MEKVGKQKSIALILVISLFVIIALLVIGVLTYMSEEYLGILHGRDRSSSFYFASKIAEEGINLIRDAKPVVKGSSYKGIDIDGDGNV